MDEGLEAVTHVYDQDSWCPGCGSHSARKRNTIEGVPCQNEWHDSADPRNHEAPRTAGGPVVERRAF